MNEEELKNYPELQDIEIPPEIYLDSDLRIIDQLLFGIIRNICLSNIDGCCWSSNKHFAILLDTSSEDISKSIENLIECGWIDTEPVDVEDERLKRRISINHPQVQAEIARRTTEKLLEEYEKYNEEQ